MKKILALLLAVLMTAALFAGCTPSEAEGSEPTKPGETEPAKPTYKLAMITGASGVEDRSFNQTVWEACEKFGKDHDIAAKYYTPAANDTASRVSAVKLAVAEGNNVVVLPGNAFAGVIAEIAASYPHVKFIALDVDEPALLAAGVPLRGEKYDGIPENWDLETYVKMGNVYCTVYQDELSGYMAGYAAVKLGYTRLGFLGGQDVPAVVRYGYGFVQGADAAARELDVQIELNYAYGSQFTGSDEITAKMDAWYEAGTQVVFACGGSIYTSAADAAKKVEGAKVIGVDVDQAAVIDEHAGVEGLTLTSAMKDLTLTVNNTLTSILVDDKWEDHAGKIETLGLISGEDPTMNYVGLPMESTQWAEGKFTQADYKALVKALFDGSVKVSDDISKEPAVTNTTVDYQGNIAE